MSHSNPPSPSRLERVGGALERALGSLASFCYRRALLASAILAAFTILFVSWAQSLRINADLTELLPDSFESVRDVRRLTDEFGGVGYVSVVLSGKSPEGLKQFAEDVAPKLSALESVRYVDYKRPDQFFREKALYYLDREDLEEVQGRLEARHDWEVARAMGTLLDEDEAPPPIDYSDLEDKYRERLGVDPGEAKAKSEYYINPDGNQLALLVKPSKLASDFGFVKQVVGEVEAVLEQVDRSKYAGEISYDLSGRYKKRVDLQNALERDLEVASLIALVLVLAYVTFHFRRLSAIILIFVPLGFTLAGTYGLGAQLIGSLNILTSFIGAILLGIAIDNGMHLLSRFDEERAAGVAPEEAIRKAFGEAGRASSAATLTNVGAFLCLSFAEFKAFREFGILAALGMATTLIAYLTVLPALLGLAAKYLPKRAIVEPKPVPFARFIVRWAAPIFVLMLLATGATASRLPGVSFNYDFSAIDSADLPSFKLDQQINQLIGRSQTPLVVLAASPEEAKQTAAALRERKAKLGGNSTIDSVLTPTDLVPTEQAEKQKILKEIEQTARALRESNLSEAQRSQRRELLTMTAAAPFSLEDLPEEVKRQFQRPGSQEIASFVLIFPSVSMSDGRMSQRIAEEARHLTLADGRNIHATGESMVLADMLTSIQRDLPIVFMLALGQQLIFLWIFMGGFRKALLTIFPALVTMPLLAGSLDLFGLQFNYLNIILLPTLLGMGEDGGAHLITRVASGEPLTKALGFTARATFGASLTTMFGFGSMIAAFHPGLRTFGLVAVLGIGINLVVCVFFLPAVIAVVARLKERFGAAPPPPAPSTSPS